MDTTVGGNAVQEWNDAVAALTGKGMNRAVAVREVNRRRPGLRQAMLAEHNQKHGRPIPAEFLREEAAELGYSPG